MDFKKKNDEDKDHFIWRVYEHRKNIGGFHDDYYGAICRRELKESFDESAYRKRYQSFDGMFDSVKYEYLDGELLEVYEDKKFEIKKETAKLISLRNIYNEHARNQGRKEFILEEIREYIKDLQPLSVPKVLYKTKTSKMDALFCIADAHYGKDIQIDGLNGDILNIYNPTIFEERMWKLRDKYVGLIKQYNISELTLLDLSDSVEGILRFTSLMTIKYGLVESAIKYGNFLSEWIKDLSQYVKINYYSCLGNHCEARILDSKSGDFSKESMQYVIDEVIKLSLIKNKRVIINDVRPLQYIKLNNISVLATHGQNEKDLVDSVLKYKEIYDIKFDYLITGHLHNSKQETASLRTKVIQCPSIIGIDDFSMKLKKTAKSEAKAIIYQDSILNNIDIEL
jgi:predicted phosphodiesterase